MYYLKAQVRAQLISLQGLISAGIVGIFLSNVPGDSSSHFDFGEVDPALAKDKTPLWVDVDTGAAANLSWPLKINGLLLNNQAKEVKAVNAVVVTVASYCVLPKSNSFTLLRSR